ncbi:MAG: MurNAc alpha-1-phosphate uridylyltransferase [Alteromonadaceae bacterium]|jgi:MurNAc alpha-1-phosphate uridylyltransferase
MKAMILAAGRGERMKPLTDKCPKPMLTVAGVPLIEYHVVKLVKAGIKDIVINHAWLGEQIEHYLKDGSQWGAVIQYSAEQDGALETAGGIIKALPLLSDDGSDEPFMVINGDVFTDFTFENLPELADNVLAHLWLVTNPEHNVIGDFILEENLIGNLIANQNNPTYTFSGIGLYRASFFNALQHNKHNQEVLALGPLLRKKATQRQISGSLLNSHWTDVGTPERLAQLNK